MLKPPCKACLGAGRTDLMGRAACFRCHGSGDEPGACKACDGRGRVADKSPLAGHVACDRCHGSGGEPAPPGVIKTADGRNLVIEKAEPDRDPVNHPAHYGGADDPYEAIKVIEAWGLGFCLGNAVKYLSRAGKKDPAKTVEDLRKAAWYLDREIERHRKGPPEKAVPLLGETLEATEAYLRGRIQTASQEALDAKAGLCG